MWTPNTPNLDGKPVHEWDPTSNMYVSLVNLGRQHAYMYNMHIYLMYIYMHTHTHIYIYISVCVCKEQYTNKWTNIVSVLLCICICAHLYQWSNIALMYDILCAWILYTHLLKNVKICQKYIDRTPHRPWSPSPASQLWIHQRPVRRSRFPGWHHRTASGP